MALFVFFIILLIVAAILLIASFFAKEYKPAYAISGILAIPIAFLVLFAGGANSVPTRSLGIPVSFGKVGAPLEPGFHWEWPWVSVAEVNETVHTVTFKSTIPAASDAPGNVTGPCLDVRIGGQQTACLDLTMQYQVDPRGASTLFYDYNGQSSDIMTTIADKVVIRELEQVVNQVLGDYNPILDVSILSNAGNSQFTTFGPKVLTAMRADLSGRVKVISLLMPLLRYDSATQARLNQIQQQYGQTAIAQQQVVTNHAQAQANAQIASSLSHDPGVLAYQCLQITQEILRAGGNLPAGWNCFGSSSSLAVTGK